ncbi:MAG: GNAT family N-acetyltransferase [Gammaproteobacteria bacterium]
MTALAFRPATAADASILSIIALEAKALWGYDETFMHACRAELTFRPEYIAAPTTEFEVATRDGALLGFSALETLGARRYELEALFIRPQQTRSGIGRQLMRRVCERVRAGGGGVITVQSDPNAAGFYAHCGGIAVGERESGSVAGRRLPLFEFRIGCD